MAIDLSVFKNQGDNDDQERDSLGWQPKETDVYTAEIKQAFLDQSAKGAFFVHFEFGFKDNTTMRYDLYFTNREGDTQWHKNGKEGNLPGFNKLNTLVEVAIGLGNEFGDLPTKTKKVEVYTGGKTAIEDRDVLTSLLGKSVVIGIAKEIRNPAVKNDKGSYDDVAGSREINEIDKFYQAPKGFTAKELRDGADTPTYVTKWLKKFKNKDIDKRTIKSDAPAGSADTGSSSGETTTPIFA